MDKFALAIEGNGCLPVYYYNESQARSEAVRLCRKTGRAVYLLQAIEVCEPTTPPIAWRELKS